MSLVDDGTVAWTDLAKIAAAEAVRLGKLNLLRKALHPIPGTCCTLTLLEKAVGALDLVDEDVTCKDSVLRADTCKREQRAVDKLDHPQYELQLQYFWVADEVSLLNVRSVIEGRLALLPHGEKVWLAVDTEWGDDKNARHCGPSIVQLALIDRVWVVDTAVLSTWLQTFFGWLFSQPCLTFFGFAFGQDIVRLSALLGEGDFKLSVNVVDLQKLASADRDKSVTPGLKAIVAAHLGVTLDKREQCSDWDRRPLTDSQLTYAAADAAVLLDIAKAMKLTC